MTQPTAPPSVLVFQMLQGLWTAHIVSAVARLDIADHIASGPMSAGELAAATSTHEHHLYRLLRTAAALGILREDGPGRFAETPISAVLRADADPGLKALAAFFSEQWHLRAWESLVESVRTGKPGIDLTYSLPLFEYFNRYPEQARNFHSGMTNLSSMEGPAVSAVMDFGGLRTVCDVGGGQGLLLSLILERNPEMRGVLFEQPDLIESGTHRRNLLPNADRIELAGGDMFASVPPGMDAYVLKRIVHDWPDAESIGVLRNCRNGVNTGGKLFVVEQVILEGEESVAAKLMDLEMMVLLTGREREEADFRRMFTEAGWRLTRILPTQSAMFVLEGVAA